MGIRRLTATHPNRMVKNLATKTGRLEGKKGETRSKWVDLRRAATQSSALGSVHFAIF